MAKGGITKLTPDNRVKLEQAAAIDASVEEMAYYCDVSRQTIYNWLENDKDLFDKIERLRAKPVLTARQTVAKGVAESYSNAMDYLKRKKKLEFGDNVDLTSDGEKLSLNIISYADNNNTLPVSSEGIPVTISPSSTEI